jgi:Ribbon-helix-helix protein, copG family
LLSWVKRKLKRADPVDRQASEPVKRDQQQNIKASRDCALAFEALAKALGMSKSDLFEDMVAERFEKERRRGAKLKISNP